MNTNTMAESENEVEQLSVSENTEKDSATSTKVPAKRGRPPKPKVLTYSVEWTYRDFMREYNEHLRKNRIPYISVGILSVWIKRHIFHNNMDADWFKIEVVEGENVRDNKILCTFKFENDAIKCERLFLEIKNKGFPKYSPIM